VGESQLRTLSGRVDFDGHGAELKPGWIRKPVGIAKCYKLLALLVTSALPRHQLTNR
jgi:hypothetical protein